MTPTTQRSMPSQWYSRRKWGRTKLLPKLVRKSVPRWNRNKIQNEIVNEMWLKIRHTRWHCPDRPQPRGQQCPVMFQSPESWNCVPVYPFPPKYTLDSHAELPDVEFWTSHLHSHWSVHWKRKQTKSIEADFSPKLVLVTYCKLIVNDCVSSSSTVISCVDMDNWLVLLCLHLANSTATTEQSFNFDTNHANSFKWLIVDTYTEWSNEAEYRLATSSCFKTKFPANRRTDKMYD